MAHPRKRLLEMVGASGANDVSARCQGLRRKVALLPRLAETLSSRVILRPSGDGAENDWDV